MAGQRAVGVSAGSLQHVGLRAEEQPIPSASPCGIALPTHQSELLTRDTDSPLCLSTVRQEKPND